jgi:L-amino acid N-acyltransferase YncA
MQTIRLATLTDLPRIVAIYNQAVAAGNATADTIPQKVEDRVVWFNEHSPEQYPIYICEDPQDQVAGWLSVSVYRPRSALQRTAEVSYYVDYSRHGLGIGSALMQQALAEAERLRKKVFLAILLEGNTGSMRLLEKFGFERWGYLPEVAELSSGLSGQFIYGRNV